MPTKKRAGSSSADKETTGRKRSTSSRTQKTSGSTATKRASRSSEGNGEHKSPTTRTRANGAGGRATTRTTAPGTTTRQMNEKTPVRELALQTAQDYNQAKKALGQLWEDVTRTTYSAFNTIAVNVEKRFEESRKAISEIDVRYALEKTQDKVKSIAKSTSATAQQMAKQVKLLYMMLKDSTAGKFKAPWVAVSAITAALLYFISPIDVLPDFIPGVGLIDDALVLSLCISVIRMDLRRYVKEKNLDLAEYGLAKEKS